MNLLPFRWLTSDISQWNLDVSFKISQMTSKAVRLCSLGTKVNQSISESITMWVALCISYELWNLHHKKQKKLVSDQRIYMAEWFFASQYSNTLPWKSRLMIPKWLFLLSKNVFWPKIIHYIFQPCLTKWAFFLSLIWRLKNNCNNLLDEPILLKLCHIVWPKGNNKKSQSLGAISYWISTNNLIVWTKRHPPPEKCSAPCYEKDFYSLLSWLSCSTDKQIEGKRMMIQHWLLTYSVIFFISLHISGKMTVSIRGIQPSSLS